MKKKIFLSNAVHIAMHAALNPVSTTVSEDIVQQSVIVSQRLTLTVLQCKLLQNCNALLVTLLSSHNNPLHCTYSLSSIDLLQSPHITTL